ncbi:MAG: nucleotidyltransferase domain-containing protein [Pirellulaceae bacterium]
MIMSQELNYDRLQQQVDEHPYPLLFATISGAHLYGFPSPDSDYDLRGVHLLPLSKLLSLNVADETVERSGLRNGIEMDLVTHDARKFFSLMLKKNGYVLEQLLSPLVVYRTPEFEELRDIAARCITRFHGYHYLGFAATQWKLFQKESPPRVKPLLYVFRVLLTGIHLVNTGIVEANLINLNAEAKLSFLDEMIEIKRSGPEKGSIGQSEMPFYQEQYEALTQELERAMEKSKLPEVPSAGEDLNQLLIRLRQKSVW